MKRKLTSLCLVLAMVCTLLGTTEVSAAKKPKLSSTSIFVLAGKTKKISVKNAKGAKIRYYSKKKKIAKVSTSGKVKGVKKGSTQIMVIVKKSGKSTKLVCKVTVVKKTKSVTIYDAKGNKASALSIEKGQKTTLKAKKSPSSSNDTIVWSTSDDEVAKVSQKGVITTTGAGTCTITAKAKLSKKKATLRLTVTRPVITEFLKTVFEKDFTIGAALNTRQFADKDTAELIDTQFNSMTMENAMKPESLLNLSATLALKSNTEVAINTDTLDEVLKTAKDNGLKLRGHCLVWHSQTPAWFFKENYNGSKNVSKEVMTARMENYIKTVMTYCQEKYPGVVYAWDVVNEAMSDGGGDSEGFRNSGSNWYSVYGDGSFVEQAFVFANKYRAEGVKLFYNDYNEYAPAKRDNIYKLVKKLFDQGVLDGVGMQSHYSMDYPAVSLVEIAIKKYASISPNLEIQLTELDIHNTDNTSKGEQKLAEKYSELFKMLLRLDRSKEANITNVTFWGLTDADTWLSNFKGEESFPLLFNKDLTAKAAFNAIIAAGKE